MIVLENIEKQFGNTPIFSGFSCKFEKGKTYALTGPSGSGKTTLLNMIGKLENFQKGEILIDGIRLKAIKEKTFFKDYMSYLFQNHGLIDNKTVKENLDLAFVGKKLSKAAKQKRMEAVLKKVNLNIGLDRKIFTLSGGEAQRVALAKTILKDSPIILADEPTASLDAKNAADVMNLLLQMKNENRIIIIATHSKEIYENADEVVEIRKEEKE
jgi:putative ABC transport system ATP-binding protein